MSEIPTSEILKTKQHFEILDGLRGVAALCVVLFHFMEWASPNYSQSFVGHGFLAVDFFFCLSGFVIGYAYDDRIGKMGIMEFFKSRIIRLHPLVILGSILGLLTFLFDPFGGHPEVYSAGKIILIFIASILLIPFPVMKDRYFNNFGFNAPAWSLFWEYIANVFYALILCRINRKYLLLLTVIAALLICFVGYRSGNLMGGWDNHTFWDGGARIFYSFSAGLLVYRYNFIIKNKLGFIGLSALLVLAFIMPFGKLNWLTEPIVVLFYFPVIIAMGSGAILSSGVKKICLFLGAMSYPLYMIHYSVIWSFGNYFTTYKPTTAQLFIVIPAAVVILIGVSYLAMTFYDIPLRKYLTSKRKQKV